MFFITELWLNREDCHKLRSIGHEIEEHLFHRLAHAHEIVVEGDEEGDDIAVLESKGALLVCS